MSFAPPPVGLHILSELSACETIGKIHQEELSEKVIGLIRDNDLTLLGSFVHEFEGGGITAIFPLAESHIAIHTWPELGYLTMEVYVCNHSKDNTDAAEQMHSTMINFFQPGIVTTHRIER